MICIVIKNLKLSYMIKRKGFVVFAEYFEKKNLLEEYFNNKLISFSYFPNI